MGLLELVLGILMYRPLWILGGCVAFAIYLIIRMRKFDQPFEEGEEGEEELPELNQEELALPPTKAPPEEAPQGPMPKLGIPPKKGVPAAVDNVEKKISQVSGHEEAARAPAAPQPAAIPKNLIAIIESLPQTIQQLKNTIAMGTSSGPPVESPIIKEIAASVAALQKQFGQGGKSAGGSGGGISPETLNKLDNLSAQFQKIPEILSGIVPKIANLEKKFIVLEATLGKTTSAQKISAGGKMPEDTLALIKGLLDKMDVLNTKLSSQKPGTAGGPDLSPMVENFSKQISGFQGTLKELKDLVAAKPTGGAIKDGTGITNALVDIKTTLNTALEAEEDLLLKISTKLNIIHQVLTSQTLSSDGGNIGGMGGGGLSSPSSGSSSGGEKDIF